MGESFVESVRKRPAMWLGNLGCFGLHHMLWEVVSNAVDEVLGGHTSRVELIFHADNSVTVADEGRGVSPDLLERALLERHNTATLDGHPWHAHVHGYTGIGLAPVNALCERFEVDTVSGGTRYRWRLTRGEPQGPIVSTPANGAVGTRVRFLPDPSFFPDVQFDRDLVHARIAEITAMLPRLTLSVRDEGCSYSQPNGLVDLLRRRHEHTSTPMHGEEVVDGTRVELAMAWGHERPEPEIYSFVNLARTIDGGTHVAGLREAIRSFAHKQEDIERGLIAYVAVMHRSVEYGGPKRDELVSREVAPIVRAVATRMLTKYFEDDED